jgi:hypothetical protein
MDKFTLFSSGAAAGGRDSGSDPIAPHTTSPSASVHSLLGGPSPARWSIRAAAEVPRCCETTRLRFAPEFRTYRERATGVSG